LITAATRRIYVCTPDGRARWYTNGPRVSWRTVASPTVALQEDEKLNITWVASNDFHFNCNNLYYGGPTPGADWMHGFSKSDYDSKKASASEFQSIFTFHIRDPAASADNAIKTLAKAGDVYLQVWNECPTYSPDRDQVYLAGGPTAVGLCRVHDADQTPTKNEQLVAGLRGGGVAGVALPVAQDVQYIRIATTTSPSWVAWTSIRVWGSPFFSYAPSNLCASANCKATASGVWAGAVATQKAQSTGNGNGSCTADMAIAAGRRRALLSAEPTAGVYWSTGTTAPGWIEIDLGENVDIDRVELLVEQTTAGSSTHTVTVGNTAGPKTNAVVKQGITKHGDVLTAPYPLALRNVRYVRVATTTDQAAWCWADIRVFGAPYCAPAAVCRLCEASFGSSLPVCPYCGYRRS